MMANMSEFFKIENAENNIEVMREKIMDTINELKPGETVLFPCGYEKMISNFTFRKNKNGMKYKNRHGDNGSRVTRIS